MRWMWRAKRPSAIKGGDDGLRELRACAAKDLAGLFETLDLCFRHDDIGKPDARQQHLAEGTRIECASVTIQAFERWQGRLT